MEPTGRHSKNGGKDMILERYYYLFRREEFIELINCVPSLKILEVNECYNNFFATIEKN